MSIDEFVESKAVDLARITGVRETTLSKYFNSHRDPSYSSLENMAIKLNMSMEAVLVGIRRRREKKKKMPKLTSLVQSA